MDSRMLLWVFEATLMVSMTAWIGAILFFSFGVAPIIFRVLEPSQAARFVRTLFPRYYTWIVTAGTVSLASFTSVVLIYPEWRGVQALIEIILYLAIVLTSLYCGNSLTPQINAARDAGPTESSRFERLHQRSVQLNSGMLLIGVFFLIIHAGRVRPVGSGVIDHSPQERLNRSIDQFEKKEALFSESK